MMNQYETVFILTPVLSDEQAKETVAKFTTLLKNNGAEIVNEENWGLKKMAYAIDKKSTGFYNLVEFKAEPNVIATLETGFRREEKVSLTKMLHSMRRSVVTNFQTRRHNYGRAVRNQISYRPYNRR